MISVHLIPVAVFCLFQGSFVICYIMAVGLGHVVPTFPYISDAATHIPESCVFSQLMNMATVLLAITVCIRYRQILELYSHHPEMGPSLLKYNKISSWFGYLTSIGISIVANFQETNARFAHYFGAFLCLGGGNSYTWMQTGISYMIQPVAGTKTRAHIRLAMATCCTILFVMQCVFGITSHRLFHGTNPQKWYPADGGWEYHIVSSVAEWIYATIFGFFILIFTKEFREVRLDHPQILLAGYVPEADVPPPP